MEVAQLLIHEGAAINMRDVYGKTPLHKAVQKKLLPIVKLLIQTGAYVHLLDNNGHAPLHLAAESGDAEVVQYLLDNDAPVNVQVSVSTQGSRLGKIFLEILQKFFSGYSKLLLLKVPRNSRLGISWSREPEAPLNSPAAPSSFCREPKKNVQGSIHNIFR